MVDLKRTTVDGSVRENQMVNMEKAVLHRNRMQLVPFPSTSSAASQPPQPVAEGDPLRRCEDSTHIHTSSGQRIQATS